MRVTGFHKSPNHFKCLTNIESLHNGRSSHSSSSLFRPIETQNFVAALTLLQHLLWQMAMDLDGKMECICLTQTQYSGKLFLHSCSSHGLLVCGLFKKHWQINAPLSYVVPGLWNSRFLWA
jgi:hypothetical protein